jgi:hypothetical protein
MCRNQHLKSTGYRNRFSTPLSSISQTPISQAPVEPKMGDIRMAELYELGDEMMIDDELPIAI